MSFEPATPRRDAVPNLHDGELYIYQPDASSSASVSVSATPTTATAQAQAQPQYVSQDPQWRVIWGFVMGPPISQLLLFHSFNVETPPFAAFPLATTKFAPSTDVGVNYGAFVVVEPTGRTTVLAPRPQSSSHHHHHHHTAETNTATTTWLNFLAPATPVPSAVTPGASDQRHEQNTVIDVQLCARKLPKMDSGPLAKSDPFFVLMNDDTKQIIHQSEVIKSTLDPDWVTFRLWLHHAGGAGGILRIDLFDWDKDGTHDFMGYATFEVRSLLDSSKTIALKSKHTKHAIIKVVSAKPSRVPVPPEPIAYTFRFAATNLDKKDGPLGKSDPFFTISVQSYTVFTSEVVPKNLDPTWHDFVLDLRELPGCTGWNTEVTITVYDYDNNGDNQEIGHFSTPLSMLLFPGFPFPLINSSKKSKPGYNNSGYFMSASAQPAPPQDAMFVADPVSYLFKWSAKCPSLLKRPDPFLVVSTRNATIYRSPTIRNTTAPSWSAFQLMAGFWNYCPREPLTFDVYDWDSNGSHSIIGTATLDTWSLRRCPNKNFQIKAGSKITGTLVCESMTPQTTYTPPYDITARAFTIKAAGGRLSIPGSLERADPFFDIRVAGRLIYRSEHAHNNNNPSWEAFTVNMTQIGGFMIPMEISVLDWESKGNHRLIGQYRTTLNELLGGPFQYPLVVKSSLGPSAPSSVIKYNIPNSNGVFSVESIQPAPEKTLLESAYALELHVSCANLVKALGLVGSCDAFFTVMTTIDGTDATIYKSEVVPTNLNPVFKPFRVPLDRGLDGPIRIHVYDYNKDGDHGYLGEVCCTPREFTFSWFSTAIKKGDSSSGSFIVNKFVVLDATKRVPLVVPPAVRFQCYANKLPVMDVSTMSIDPFFCVKIHNATVYRSEYVPKNQAPRWKECVIPLSTLTGPNDYLEIEVYDFDKDGTHDCIGKVRASWADLQWSWFEEGIKSGATINGAFGIKEIVPCALPSEASIKSVTMTCNITKLERSDNPLLKTDAFFVVWLDVKDTTTNRISKMKVYKSEVVKQNLAPQFEPFTIPLDCGLDTQIQFQVFDWDADGAHDTLGGFTLTARDLTFSWFSSAIHKSDGGSAGGFNINKLTLQDTVVKILTPELPPAVRMCIYANKLPVMDPGTLSADPFFVIRKFDPAVGAEITLYRSEVHKHTLSPKWDTFCLPLALFKDCNDPIEVKVFDWDKDGTHDLIGTHKILFRELQWSWYEEGLTNDGSNQGCIGVKHVEPIPPLAIPPVPPGLRVWCSAAKLARMDGPAGSSDPFFVVSARPPGFPHDIILYRSEVIKKCLTPVWDAFDLSVEAIGGIDKFFTISVYDFDYDGGHDVIGELKTTLRELGFGQYQQALYSGSSSRGSFSFDRVEAISHVPLPSWAPAYKVFAAGYKIARLDYSATGAQPSDPFFVVRVVPPGYDKEITIYRSPVIKKCDNPKWGYFILDMSLIGGLDTPFKISVMDWDADGGHDLVGECKITMREWCFGPYRKALINPDKLGLPGYDSSGAFSCEEIIPVFEPVEKRPLPVAIEVSASAQKLERKDGPLGKSDPFFVVSAQPPGFHHEITLYRSEVVMKNLNPVWKPFMLNLSDIGGVDSPFTITVYDWDADGAHDLIGRLTTTYREWMFGPYQQALVNPSKKNLPGYESSGAFSVDNIMLVPQEYRKFIPAAFQISPSAQKLVAKDIDGTSDPFFEIKAKPPGFTHPITIYRSEVVKSNLKPVWKPFIMNLVDITDLDTEFTVYIYDWDKDGGHELIGSANTIMREWMFFPYQFAVRSSSSSRSCGAFSVDFMQPMPPQLVPSIPPAFLVKTSAQKLAIRDVSMSSDPFFEILVTPPSMGTPILMHRSNVVMKSLKPDWEPFEFNLSMVGGLDSPFIVNVYDWDRDGGHDLIGTLTTTLREWTFGPYQQALRLGGSSSQGAFSVDEITPLSSSQMKPIAIAYEIRTSVDKMPLTTGATFLEVKAQPFGFDFPITMHRSEVVKDGKHAHWDPFVLNVFDIRGLDTIFTLSVWEHHTDGSHKKLGSLHTTLRTWTFGPFRECIRSGSSEVGALCVDEVRPLAERVDRPLFIAYRVHPFGAKLARKDLSGKSDPFFEIRVKSTANPHKKYITIYRSEVVMNNLNPSWKPFELSTLAVGGFDTPFEIAVFDWDADGGHDLIGRTHVTLRDWLFGEYRTELISDSSTVLTQGSFGVTQMDGLTSTDVKPVIPACFARVGVAKLAPTCRKPFFEMWVKKKLYYRSKPSKSKNGAASWDSFPINIEDLHDIDSFFKIKVRDFSEKGEHTHIGSLQTTFRDWTFGEFRFGLTKKHQLTDSSAAFCIEAIEPRNGRLYPFTLDGLPTDYVPPAFTLSCSGVSLDRKDVTGKSDPFFKIIGTPSGFSSPITLYRSEVIRNTLKPKWAPCNINTDWVLGLDGSFTVSVLDWDADGDHDEIGTAKVTLRDIIHNGFSFPLKGPKLGLNSGAFKIDKPVGLAQKVESVQSAPAFQIQMSARKLPTMDGIRLKSDPFFTIKAQPSGYSKEIVVYRSEVIPNTLEPAWKPFVIGTADIPFDSTFEISVFDADPDGGHDLIGQLSTTLREISFGNVQMALHKHLRVGSRGCVSFDVVQPLPSFTRPVFAEAYTFSMKAAKLNSSVSVAPVTSAFFEITSCPKNSRTALVMYRSLPVASPKFSWSDFTLSVAQLGDPDTPFTITVYSFKENGAHQFVGDVTTNLRECALFGPYLIGLHDPSLLNLLKPTRPGTLLIESVSPAPLANVPAMPVAIQLDCSGLGFENKDAAGLIQSDPFFEVRRLKGVLLYRSEMIKNNSNPVWRQFTLSHQFSGGVDSPLEIIAYDWDKDGHHDLIGSFVTTYRDLALGSLTRPLKNENKVLSIGYKSSGGFNFRVTPLPTYTEVSLSMQAFKLCAAAAKLIFPLTDLKKVPFFEVRVGAKGKKRLIYRSAVAQENMEWAPFTLNINDVGGIDGYLHIWVWNQSPKGDHLLIGKLKTTLREMTFGLPYSMRLVNKEHQKLRPGYTSSGAFIITLADPLPSPVPFSLPPALRITPSGISLKKSGIVERRFAPFFEIMAPLGSSQIGFALVYRSKVYGLEDSSAGPDSVPQWQPFELSPERVGGWDTEFFINCYHWDSDGTHDLIGKTHTTLRELLFGPYTLCLEPEDRTPLQSKSAGGLQLAAEFLPVASPFIIPPGVVITVNGLKLDIGKGVWFEMWLIGPGVQETIIYRSESVDGHSPQWRPSEIWPAQWLTMDNLWRCIFNIHVYGWNHNQIEHVGSSMCSYQDFLFGSWTGTLINKRKKKHGIGYKNSGGIQFHVTTPTRPMPTLSNACEYAVTFDVHHVSKDSQAMALSVCGKSTNGKEVVLCSEPCPTPLGQCTVIVPFESVSGPSSKISVKLSLTTNTHWIHDKICTLSFKTSLLQLALPGFSASVKIPRKLLKIANPLEPKPALATVSVVSCVPRSVAIPGYAFTLQASGLPRADALTDLSDPFVQVKAEKGQVIHTSEVHNQDLNPKFAPFVVDIAAVGGMDAILTFNVMDYDPSGTPDFLGSCSMCLRRMIQLQQLPLWNSVKAARLTDYNGSGYLKVIAAQPATNLPPLPAPHAFYCPQPLSS
ncbi:hypothetical protein Pelo_11264 [Pelomyxa schiedti]|nr:hypothetical protein Pelo_11264 [Pelomyxa schiedti]